VLIKILSTNASKTGEGWSILGKELKEYKEELYTKISIVSMQRAIKYWEKLAY